MHPAETLHLTACCDYNYNLAEVTVPISMISYMRDNLPFLKKTGCLGINVESMAAWNLYGPHTYLASRLMWHAGDDAGAILDDYARMPTEDRMRRPSVASRGLQH